MLGGSLADVIADNITEEVSFSESELKEILLQASRGLRYIHSQNLVHLDIKPGKYLVL